VENVCLSGGKGLLVLWKMSAYLVEKVCLSCGKCLLISGGQGLLVLWKMSAFLELNVCWSLRQAVCLAYIHSFSNVKCLRDELSSCPSDSPFACNLRFKILCYGIELYYTYNSTLKFIKHTSLTAIIERTTLAVNLNNQCRGDRKYPVFYQP
jgi:hypothetical protein